MENYLKLTIDYLEGRVQPAVYERLLEQNDDLYRWIQGLVKPEKKLNRIDRIKRDVVEHPYDIRDVLDEYNELDQGGPRGSVSYHYHIHNQIADLVLDAFPDMNITVDMKPAQLRKLFFSACPDYIGGTEVAQNGIISRILETIPQDISFTKQKRLARERIKEAFHIEGRKWPYWIQAPEWPVHNGEPMKYFKTVKVNSEYVQHYFMDIHTNTTRIVDDFY